MKKLVLVIAAALLFPAGAAWPAEAKRLANKDCLTCHAEPVGQKPSALPAFPHDKFKKSVHAGADCVDCHDGIKDLKHPAKLPPPQCGGCHEKEAKQYATSIHGAVVAMGSKDAAKCSDCHGHHDILPVKHADSPVFKLNLPQTCARCHNNAGLTAEYRMKYPDAASQYMESIHGRALMKLGLIVAPACNDCHGVHDIRRSVDANSPIHKTHIAKTCGKCHVGVEKIYNESVHGKLLAQGDTRGPSCPDCHTPHQIQTNANGQWKAASDERCGQCHKDRLANYRETFHGKAMALGAPNVAACFDCHGHHDVLPPSDPRSKLAPANIVETCKQCHPKATTRFAQYQPHADPMDKTHYPALHYVFLFMTALLIGTFGFFGLHTLFWLFRSAFLYHHDSKTFREKRTAGADEEWFTRFTPFERLLHLLMMTSFLLLVITGMPLKFYYTAWARAIMGALGGVEVVRSLHRFGAMITFLYFGLHLLAMTGMIWRRRGTFRDPATGKFRLRRVWALLFGPDSMCPSLQDLRDFIAHQKWFFGKGPSPQFERWTYWEKFDYLAVFWGVAFIGISGIIMWAAQSVTHVLPGWAINIALIIHSDEALLAAGFIFAFHFFNVHFRPEKFPMDPVIFSGRISKTELLHSRKRWWDRMVAENRLDEWRVKDEWERWKKMAHPFGYLMFTLGILLLVLIVYAMSVRLGH